MDIICPLTNCIFKEPVTASDGFVYEKKEIIKWFEKYNTSPTLKIHLKNTSLIQNKMIENKVKSHLMQYPDKVTQQYEFEIRTYKQWVAMNNRDLLIIPHENLKSIFSKITVEQVIHILNVVTDINKELHFNNRIIHYVCEYSSIDVINFTVDHYLTNKLTLHCKNKENVIPIHLICYKCPLDTVKKICDYYIKNNYDIDHKNDRGITALGYACENATRDVINYLISLNVDMTFCVRDDYQYYTMYDLLLNNTNVN